MKIFYQMNAFMSVMDGEYNNVLLLLCLQSRRGGDGSLLFVNGICNNRTVNGKATLSVLIMPVANMTLSICPDFSPRDGNEE